MHYLGGKARVGPKIVQFLESIRDGRDFYEPFCGGLWITYRMSGVRHASDVGQALITLYKALQGGWGPPSVVTEEEYQIYKEHKNPTDPLTAFIGYGCSYSGKYFGGFARDGHGRNYAKNAKNSLIKKMAKCQDVIFDCQEYSQLNVKNALIYCDPPYFKTTKYGVVGNFDHDRFWDWCRDIRKDNILVVSEYTAPEDFKCVLEIPTRTDLHTQDRLRIERLFM